MSDRSAEVEAMAFGAEQMKRDGIYRLPEWGNRKDIGAATYRWKLPQQRCASAGCCKKARYQTPLGVRCFEHAAALRAKRPTGKDDDNDR